MTERGQGIWRMPLYAAVGAVCAMVFVFIYSSDPALLYLFFLVPIACLASLIVLAVAVIKRTRRSFSMLLSVLAFVFVSGAMLKTQDVLRPWLRWQLWSRRLKAEVFAQPTPPNNEFKHIEWDGWGGAPVGDWTAYVVYDPGDSLSVAAKNNRPGVYQRYEGIPCEVDSVRRLETHWYSVVLGVNEWWDRCG